VYAYRVARPEGFGVQRLYTRDGVLDETWTVRDRDIALVPRGYHPFVAGHGFDCYYLNALAGDTRSMAASDDPDLAWTRAAWAGQTRDPRVPMVGPGR
jgi:5-deoxy-glucuronate isomerase